MTAARWMLLALMVAVASAAYIAPPTAAYAVNILRFGFYTYPAMEPAVLNIGFGQGDDAQWRLYSIKCDCRLQEATGLVVVEGSELYDFLDGVLSIDIRGGKPIRELVVGGNRLLYMEKHTRDAWLLRWS